jgi:hypothetical protein
MRGLALIAEHFGSHGDRILRAERNIDLFLIVAVEIAEDQAIGSVGIMLPSFKCGSDVLTACILNLGA